MTELNNTTMQSNVKSTLWTEWNSWESNLILIGNILESKYIFDYKWISNYLNPVSFYWRLGLWYFMSFSAIFQLCPATFYWSVCTTIYQVRTVNVHVNVVLVILILPRIFILDLFWGVVLFFFFFQTMPSVRWPAGHWPVLMMSSNPLTSNTFCF